MFGKGISQSGDILDLAANIDIVNKSGAWYQYNSEKIGQGRENAKAYLEEHPEVMAEIEGRVREFYNLPADEFSKAQAAKASGDAGEETAAKKTTRKKAASED